MTINEVTAINEQNYEDRLTPDQANMLARAVAINLMVIEATKAAEEKAYSQVLLDYADEAEDEHRRVQEALKKAARKNDILVPSDVSPDHQELLDQLQRQDKVDYDRVYAAQTEKSLRKILDLLAQLNSVDNEEVRNTVEKSRERIQTQMVKLQQLQKQIH